MIRAFRRFLTLALALFCFTAFWLSVPALAENVGDPCTGTNRAYSVSGETTSLLICNGSTLELLEKDLSNPVRKGIGTASPAATLHVNGEAILGNTGLACSATTKGAMRYNTSTDQMQYCDGTIWRSLVNNNTPASFSFTDQTGVAANATITSNAVTLTGFVDTLTAVCSANCTAIARNGVWGGTSMVGFVPGDTIAIRMTSATTSNTLKAATVTVGATTSGLWSVTTGTNSPAPFSFTDVTTSGVLLGETVWSNAVTLTGFTGPLTAVCGGGCLNIRINGGGGQGQTAGGIMPGNTIAILQASSTTYGDTRTATVTVGSTVSGVWTVTTQAAPTLCAGASAPGDICPDGTVFAGLTPDGNVPMYVTRCAPGRTWDGSACTGTKILKDWNNGTNPTFITTGYTSTITGSLNTAGLVALSNAESPYRAAQYCYDLVIHGHDDWYLPAGGNGSGETWVTIVQNRAVIPDLAGVVDRDFYTSTEISVTGAVSYRSLVTNPTYWNTYKWLAGYNGDFRCARK